MFGLNRRPVGSDHRYDAFAMPVYAGSPRRRSRGCQPKSSGLVLKVPWSGSCMVGGREMIEVGRSDRSGRCRNLSLTDISRSCSQVAVHHRRRRHESGRHHCGPDRHHVLGARTPTPGDDTAGLGGREVGMLRRKPAVLIAEISHSGPIVGSQTIGAVRYTLLQTALTVPSADGQSYGVRPIARPRKPFRLRPSS
jgi:hypothetical protein